MKLPIKFSPVNPDIEPPRYMSDGAAGFDLRADILTHHTIMPGKRVLVPTGIYVAVPDGYEMQVRPRSGLAAKQGITVVNTPGTVDSDYRGEVKVALVNIDDEPRTIEPGDRIAQAVIAPVQRAEITLVDFLPGTRRGASGFGSTGVK